MNGFEIAGRPIRVGLVTEKGGSSAPSTQTHPHNSGGSGMGMGMQRGGGSMMRPDSLDDGSALLPSDKCEEAKKLINGLILGGGGLNSISRIELMQKLARTESTTNSMGAPTMPM